MYGMLKRLISDMSVVIYVIGNQVVGNRKVVECGRAFSDTLCTSHMKHHAERA